MTLAGATGGEMTSTVSHDTVTCLPTTAFVAYPSLFGASRVHDGEAKIKERTTHFIAIIMIIKPVNSCFSRYDHFR